MGTELNSTRHKITAMPEHKKRDISDDELFVVTGGGSGIGQAITLRLLTRGLNVLIMGPFANQLEETTALVDKMKLKGTLMTVKGDIRSPEGRKGVYEAIEKSQKTLRVIIHNAGVNTPCKNMMDLKEAEWNRAMDINANGPLWLTKDLLPLFGKEDTEKNRVLFLTTIAKTCKGLPSYGPYCVSKLMAYGIAQMFREELPKGKTPVYCSTLIPGEVNTEMQRITAFSHSSNFPDHLVKHWRMLHETNQLLPTAVPGAFAEYVTVDTPAKEFQNTDWFVYDKYHHAKWAGEFSNVKIVEPKGLTEDH